MSPISFSPSSVKARCVQRKVRSIRRRQIPTKSSQPATLRGEGYVTTTAIGPPAPHSSSCWLGKAPFERSFLSLGA
jgi:hypothetical protein